MKKGFTLSEILITLGVIGVVSAMTLPTVIKNYQKKVTVERLKSTYSTLYQAIRRSEVDNGTLNTWEFPVTADNSYEVNKAFGEKYLIPYLKNVKECNSEYCFSKIYYDINRIKYNYTSQSCSLVLSNGVVITILSKTSNLKHIYVDINGKKGPNTIGKDVFLLILSNKTVNSVFYGKQDKPGLFFYGQGLSNKKLKTTYYACSKTEGTEWRGVFCGALIMQNNWQMPEDYPW